LPFANQGFRRQPGDAFFLPKSTQVLLSRYKPLSDEQAKKEGVLSGNSAETPVKRGASWDETVDITAFAEWR